MGLIDRLRRRDELAIPPPGSPEFDAAVKGTALPDAAGIEMGSPGWSSADPSGDSPPGDGLAGAAIDARVVPGSEPAVRPRTAGPSPVTGPARRSDRRSLDGVLGALGQAGVRLPKYGTTIPGAGGLGGWIGSSAKLDPQSQLEHLSGELEAGRITEAEFEAQKRHLLRPGA